MQKTTTRLAPAIVLLSFTIAATSAFSAGFALQEQSVSGLGNAFAGAAAVAEDASTLYFNPAGLALLKGPQLLVGGHAISPAADYTDTGSVRANGAAMDGEADVELEQIALVPNLYYARPINNQTTFGFGINAPFGLSTEYDEDWVGRYHAIESALSVISFAPALAIKYGDNITFGGTFNLYYADVKLTNDIDFGYAALGPNGAGSLDVHGDLGGDGFGSGYSAGATVKLHQARFGMVYRSQVRLNLTGEADFTLPSNLPAFLVAAANDRFADQGIKATPTLPDSAAFSLLIPISDAFTLLWDASWTGWDSFDELRVDFDTNDDYAQPENWESSWRYAVGGTYQLNNRWKLRGGFALEETPIPSDEDRTPRIPDNDRQWFTGGLSYILSDRITVDAALAYIKADETEIHNTEITTQHVLNGEYDSDVTILSVQTIWHL
jgi:long-chain fatty acid transport protein